MRFLKTWGCQDVPLSSCGIFAIRDNKRDKVEKLFIIEISHTFPTRPDEGFVMPCPYPGDSLSRDVMPFAPEKPPCPAFPLELLG